MTQVTLACHGTGERAPNTHRADSPDRPARARGRQGRVFQREGPAHAGTQEDSMTNLGHSENECGARWGVLETRR